MKKTYTVEGQINLLDFAAAEKEHKKTYNLEVHKIRTRKVDDLIYLTDKQQDLTKEDFKTPKEFIESVLKRNFIEKFPELSIHSVALKSNKLMLTFDLKQKEKDNKPFDLTMNRVIKGADFNKLYSSNFETIKEGLKDARKAFMLFAPALENYYKEVEKTWDVFKKEVDISKDKEVHLKFIPLTSQKYLNEPTASVKLQAYYPGTEEFKYFSEEQAQNVLKLRQIEPFEKGDQLIRACRKINERIDSGALNEELRVLTESATNSFFKAEKTIEQHEMRQDIIDQFSLEFPAIKYISLEAAEAISQYQIENEEFTSIKEVSKAYKKLGKQLEKYKDEFDKERINNNFKKLSIAVEGIDKCKKEDIQIRNDLIKTKQLEKMNLER